jgi:hypothetical protein
MLAASSSLTMLSTEWAPLRRIDFLLYRTTYGQADLDTMPNQDQS